MKITIGLLGLLAILNSSCHKKESIVEPTPVASASVSVPVIPSGMANDNIKLSTLAVEWEEVIAPTTEIKLMAKNTKYEGIFVLSKEPFIGSYEEAVLDSIRSFKQEGAVVSSSVQVESNGLKWVLLNTSRDHIAVWQWITVVNGYSYTMACGGSDSYLVQLEDSCNSIFSNLSVD